MTLAMTLGRGCLRLPQQTNYYKKACMACGLIREDPELRNTGPQVLASTA